MNAEDLVIIAARPGMGKTELALKIAEGVQAALFLVLTSGAGY
ncbi:DnaB helicase C-terminal domain-containing protein [Escherichia coli]|nr:DnaB helicase C-terminal domain-containing protein [Escherichia coli]